MAIRKIARMGHPVLREKARQLTKEEILSPDMKVFLQDMIDTMNDYGGIGLAAPQVYESIAVAIVDYQDDHPRYAAETKAEGKAENQKSEKDSKGKLALHSLPFTIVFNPKITVLDSTEQSFWEGCLSVPELRGLVARPRKVQIDFLDLKAQPRTVVVEGFLATVFQHELDHLEGIVYVDHVKTAPGKNVLSFTEEYTRFLAPEEGDDVGELPE